MPILWRYILKIFLKHFFLSLIGSIALGVALKHQTFARFIALGANAKMTSLLIACYLCHILPIMISIVSFLSSFVTIRNMATSLKITMLRTSTLSIKTILTPLYYSSVILSIIIFFITSELTPYTKLIMSDLFYKSKKELNPILMLRKNDTIFKNSYTEMFSDKSNSFAKDVLIVYNNPSLNRLGVIAVESLNYNDDHLSGEGLSLITYTLNEDQAFDNLIIDSQKTVSTQNSYFSSLLEDCTLLPRQSDINPLQGLLKSNDMQSIIEIFNRISKGVLPITFTMLGVSFGLFERNKLNGKKQILLIFLIVIQFASICLAHKLRIQWQISALIFFLPHLLSNYISIKFAAKSKANF